MEEGKGEGRGNSGVIEAKGVQRSRQGALDPSFNTPSGAWGRTAGPGPIA